MKTDHSYETVCHMIMIEEPAPTREALARWQQMYPKYSQALGEFFEMWAEDYESEPGPEAVIELSPETEARIEQEVAWALDVLRKQGRLIPEDYVAAIQPFDQVILAAVIELQGLGYNGNIARLASEMSGKTVLMGTALGSLIRLERLKCLVWRYADPVTEPQNEGRRYYMATIAGERSLAHARAAAQSEAGFQGDFA